MMKVSAVVFSILVGVSAFAAEYDVRTVEGQVVRVAADDLAEAYGRMIADSGEMNVHFTNFDGTVTVKNPQFLYRGEMFPLSSDTSETYSQGMQSVCSLQGLGAYRFRETGAEAKGVTIVNGTIGKISGSQAVTSYTCAAK
jgi:hypothetical protein